jgi:hypothetical protein
MNGFGAALRRTRQQGMAWLRMRREMLRTRWVCHRVRRRLPLRGPAALPVPAEGRALHERFRGLSTNRANQLRLQLDRTMRPSELKGLMLAYLASGDRSAALEAWLCETHTDAPTLLWDPAAYRPAELLPETGEGQLRLYRRVPREPGAAIERLVVAFTSNANALSMIGPCFLQQMGPFATDVLLVTRSHPQRDGYFGDPDAHRPPGSDPAPPPGRTRLGRICARIAGWLPLQGYRRVVTVGYSGGGFPSAVAAVALGAERGICLGGCPPGKFPLPDPLWLEELIASLPSPPRRAACRLLFCVAGGCVADRRGAALALAKAAAWRRPGLELEGRAYRGCRDHNLLVELQRRGHPLPPVLTDLLFPGDPVVLPRQRRWRPTRHDPLSV